MGNKATKAETKQPSEEDDDDFEADAQENSNKPSYYTMMKQAYQSLVNAIIRPPRSDYETSQLGPVVFQFCGKTFKRNDFELTNPRNLKFVCSMWEPIPEDRPNKVLPCVIYMHGNSSSRLEALSSLSLVLSLGATLLCLDFCGSGKSEGEYVTLGYFEKDDLDVVVQHLRDTGTTSTIALWGRSMGAATALLHGERDPSIAGMVLDSAFADLVMLAEELVDRGREKGLFAPGVLVKLALRFVRSSVMKQAGFDIRLLSPIEHADKCFIPAMFVAAEGDGFVGKQHSEKIFEKYGGDKNIVLVEGDHNTARPLFLYDSVSIFLVNTLQIPDDWILPEGQNFIRKYPWTYRAKQYGKRDSSSGAGGAGRLPAHLAVQFNPSPTSDDSEDQEFLQQAIALSLLESQGGTIAQTPGGNIEVAPNMEDDAAMQVEVQAALFNMLSAGTAGKGSNRTGKPNTPIAPVTSVPATASAHVTNTSAGIHHSHHHHNNHSHQSLQSNGHSNASIPKSPGKHDDVPDTVSDKSDNTKNHLKNGKLMLAQSADDGEDFEKLPSASRHPSGISSTTTTPIHASGSPQKFFAAGLPDDVTQNFQLHPKALANKNYGKSSSFNKVFGSNHSMEDAGDETDCVSDSDKMAGEDTTTAAEQELIHRNTALNSSSGASEELVKKYSSKKNMLNSASEETFGLNKAETLSEFDLQDSIEFDLGSIKFHSKSKSIKFSNDQDPGEVPEMTAEDEFGYDTYSSQKSKKTG